MSTVLEDAMAEMKAARQKIKELAMTEGRPLLEKAAQPLFDLGVDAIKWRQYTPYFNDGDACEFSVNDPSVHFGGVPEDGGDYEDGFVDAWSIDYLTKDGRISVDPSLAAAIKEALTGFAKVICSEDAEPFMLDLFGDHVSVKLSRPVVIQPPVAFDVEDYDHD